jgi:hypothetical protein
MKSILGLNAVLLVFFFAVWCVVDYYAVQSPRYPEDCHDGEWTFIFIPLVAVVANLVAQRKRGLGRAVLTAVAASFAVCVLFLGMLVFPGMCFHFTIGGRL